MTDPRVLAVERWARSQHDVVSAAQADLGGLPRPWPQRLVTRGRWVRLLRGVFWTRPEGPPPDDLLLLAARLFAGWGHEPFGVLVGRSAARAWGLPDTRIGWRPEVALPVRTRRRQPRGLRYRWDDLPSSEITCHRGFVCTVPLRTLRDVAAECRFDDALAMADAALREGLATPTDLQTIGTGAGLSVLRHANGRAESPLESRVRAELLLAGLPAPSIQHDIRDDTGRFLARVDFAWPGGVWWSRPMAPLCTHRQPPCGTISDARTRSSAPGGRCSASPGRISAPSPPVSRQRFEHSRCGAPDRRPSDRSVTTVPLHAVAAATST